MMLDGPSRKPLEGNPILVIPRNDGFVFKEAIRMMITTNVV